MHSVYYLFYSSSFNSFYSSHFHDSKYFVPQLGYNTEQKKACLFFLELILMWVNNNNFIFFLLSRPDVMQQHGHHTITDVVLEDGKFQENSCPKNEIIYICVCSRYRSTIFTTYCNSKEK